MERNLLAKFKYNGKIYVYYRESDTSNIIKYGVLENDKIIEVKDPKDIQIMNEASKKIFISSNPKNHIKLGIRIYRGKKFQQMFDEQSELKFFYEIKDGKYYIPSNEDALALFEMFNLHDLYINQENGDNQKVFFEPDFNPNKKKKEDPIKTIVKGFMIFGVSTLAVIAISTCLLRTNAIEEVFRPNYESGQTVTGHNEEYLINAIRKNKNLTNGEKQVFKDQLEFVMKYADYTDFEALGNRLETVTSENIEGSKEGEPSVAADYNRDLNRIRDFNSKKFDDNSKSDFGHEVGHCFASPLCTHPGIFEATTEIVNSEHEYASDITSYADIIAFQKVMYEIIGQDPFGRYQQSGDINHITEPLMKLLDDKFYADQLIVSLDNLIVDNKVANDLGNKYSEEERKTARENCEIDKMVILMILDQYFYAAKGYSMYEDAVAMLYLNSANIINNKFSISYDSSNYEIGYGYYYFKKGYFLDEYMSKYADHTLIFYYEYDGKITEIKVPITDSNRRISSIDGVYNIEVSNLSNVK